MIATLSKSLNNHYKWLITIGVAICCVIVILVVAQPAYAGITEDAIKAIDAFIKKVFLSMVANLYENSFKLLQSISLSGPMGAPWENLFAGSSNAFLKYTTDISNGVIKPIAKGVLSLVFLLMFIDVADKMKSNEVLPHVYEIVILVAKMAIFLFLINHMNEIAGECYNILNKITLAIQKYQPDVAKSFGELSLSSDAFNQLDDATLANVPYGQIITTALGALVTLIFSGIAYLLSYVVLYARAIQLYVYACFAPLAVAFIGLEHTRQWGVGFIKQFLSISLANVILILVFLSFPIVVSSIIIFEPNINFASMLLDSITPGNPSFATVALSCKIIAICVVLIKCIVSSGAWARDIFGG